jgi:hypothetical protein
MHAAISPLPNTPSWRGARFKKSTRTTLPLPLSHGCFVVPSILKFHHFHSSAGIELFLPNGELRASSFP